MVAVSLAIAGGWLVGPRVSGVVREAAVSLASMPVRSLRARAAGAITATPRLAANQLGFAPGGPKQFSSPSVFTSFVVIHDATGQAVWQGRTPPRRIEAGAADHSGAVWVGDFSPFATPGRYHIEADNGLASHPFTIAPEVFDVPRRLVQRVFYFQRAFTAIEPRFAEGPWVHTSDAHRAPAGVRGGWHDAGDYSLYNMTTTSSLFWLLEAHRDFGPGDDRSNIPESGNGVPDTLDEARVGLEWLLSMQDAAGGVRHATCLETYDAYGANPLESGPAYVHGEVGTLATARAVGIFGSAAPLYRAVDAAFAERLVAAARRGWQFLGARPDEHSDGATCGAYRQDGDAQAGRATRMFAAAGLLVATGDPVFERAFAASFVDIDEEPSPYRFSAYASLLYRRADAADPARVAAIEARLATVADAIVRGAEAHAFGWTGRYVWGSVAVSFERAGLLVARCLAGRDRRVCEAALTNLDYTFGRNSLGLAYVSGIPGVQHGRRHAFHHWLATLDATPFLFPGAVAGGPNARPEPADGSRPLARPRAVWGYWGDPAMPRSAATPLDGRYTDNDSWSTNEVAIAWQAPALYNLAFAAWTARQDAERAAK